MQAPNAQGLAGLASRPQQQGPTPDRASPMAGLGSVEDRVAAYRGNPAPLQQRYAVSQDLLDLLALQKIKSEKEAAARDMQLKLGQQAAAQGGQPPTIAQQREKEVMDMTKAELARQRGATAEQQDAQQQQAMQALMSGIAAVPGAQSAAQPTMMASGGIVAFAGEDDRVGSVVPEAEIARILAKGPAARTPEENATLERAGYKLQRRTIPQGSAVDRADVALRNVGPRVRDYATAGASKMSDEELAQATDLPGVLTERGLRALGINPSSPTPMPTAPVPSSAGAGRGMINPPMADPSAPLPTPKAKPAAEGIVAAPGAQNAPAQLRPAPPAAPAPQDPLREALVGAALEGIKRDSNAERIAEEQRVEGRLMFPEEQERRRKMIDEQRRMYEQEFDPERQRQEALRRFMLGAGGRRYGVLSGGSGAALDYETAQRGAQRERLKGLEDMEQGLFGLRQGAVEKGIGSGKSVYEQAETSRRNALEAGRGVYGTDVQAREKALDREIERLKVEAQNELTRANKEGINLTRSQTLYAKITSDLSKYEADLRDSFENAYFTQLQAERNGNISAQQKQQLDAARLRLNNQIAAKRKELEPVMAPLLRQIGGGMMDNLSPEAKAAFEKYKQ